MGSEMCIRDSYTTSRQWLDRELLNTVRQLLRLATVLAKFASSEKQEDIAACTSDTASHLESLAWHPPSRIEHLFDLALGSYDGVRR